MKRSSQITLVLLASMSTFALSGCDNQPAINPDSGGTFANLAECVAKYDQKTCDAAQKLAQQQHLQNAPHYGTREQCVLQYGPDMCQPSSYYGGHDNSYMPLMIGYMMGSAMSQPTPLYYGPGAYRHYGQAGYAAPIYSSSPSYRSSGPIGSAPYTPTSRGSLNSSTSLTPAGTQRGGFGSSFHPTSSFKSSYSAANPDSFGRSGYSQSTGAMPAKSYSSYTTSRASSYSGSSYSSSTSRGGFGSSGRSFGGGSFGG